MKLYRELAPWWPLFSSPAEYADEAAYFHELIRRSSACAPRTLLELGSGGGNNAVYLKQHYTMTLVDIEPDMLAVSNALNPECEHHAGDMRDVRLGREFDAVFVHDAINYMTSLADLRAAMATAFAHCEPGGLAVFVPDFVRETFAQATSNGGNDGQDGAAVRYLLWTHDDDASRNSYHADFVVLVRERGGELRVVHDRHTLGLFTRSDWLTLLADTGFAVDITTDPWDREVFIATKPA